MSSQPTTIEIGKLHPWHDPAVTEGMRAIVDGDDSVNLLLWLHPCGPAELRSFRDGVPMRVGLLSLAGGYVWLLNNVLACYEAPYCPWLESPERRDWGLRQKTPNTRLALLLHVIDRRGIARHLRLFSVSPAFTRRALEAHAEALRAENKRNRRSWAGELTAYQRRFPNPLDAMRAAATQCDAGE